MSKNYLIIGASSGIGAALTQKVHSEGINTFASYFKNEKKSSVPGLNYFHLNVLDDYIDLDFLPETIDGLAYCPGSINLKPFNRIKPQQFVEDFELQVNGAIKVIQNILPKLKNAEQAAIVLFSTVAVQSGFNYHSQVSSSKGAIEGLTRALAAEFAPKVRVNAVAPSLTNTPLASRLLNTVEKIQANAQRHPLKKIGSPETIAETAAFLLSNQSSWITGQVIHVDGGISTIKS